VCFHLVDRPFRHVYPICTDNFLIQNRIELPCARNIGLEPVIHPQFDPRPPAVTRLHRTTPETSITDRPTADRD